MAKDAIKPIASFVEISERADSIIKGTANETAINSVIDGLVSQEVERRASLLLKGLEAYNKAKKELAACKPDVQTFSVVNKEGSEDGGVGLRQEAYSANMWSKREKLQKLVAELDIAFLKAMENDFTKLEKAIGNGGGQATKE